MICAILLATSPLPPLHMRPFMRETSRENVIFMLLEREILAAI